VSAPVRIAKPPRGYRGRHEQHKLRRRPLVLEPDEHMRPRPPMGTTRKPFLAIARPFDADFDVNRVRLVLDAASVPASLVGQRPRLVQDRLGAASMLSCFGSP
jgi:hypothetical protein